jgi:chromosome segregation ATPase
VLSRFTAFLAVDEESRVQGSREVALTQPVAGVFDLMMPRGIAGERLEKSSLRVSSGSLDEAFSFNLEQFKTNSAPIEDLVARLEAQRDRVADLLNELINVDGLISGLEADAKLLSLLPTSDWKRELNEMIGRLRETLEQMTRLLDELRSARDGIRFQNEQYDTLSQKMRGHWKKHC